VAGGVGIALVAACSAQTGSANPLLPSKRPSHPAGAGPPATAHRSLALQITPAAYQLPAGISREVVLPWGRHLLILGGLDQRSATTRAVVRLNAATGRAVTIGRLAGPIHDAAGAVLGGRPYVFGGGMAASVTDVQALHGKGTAAVAGHLPRRRSDLSAVTLGRTAYLVGGYDGAAYDPQVIATTDGQNFRTAARLPVPVRYAGVAGTGNRIWVFGGQAASGLTDVIQQITLPSGKATIVGHLPERLSGASAFALAGHLFIAGGQVLRRGRTVTSGIVWAYDAAKHRAVAAGRLPYPVSNAAYAAVGGTAFLVGGSNGQRQVPSVTRLRLVTAASALPGTGTAQAGADDVSAAVLGSDAARRAALPASPVTAGTPWLSPPHGKGHLAPGSDPSVLPGDILIADNRNNRLLIVDPLGRIRWRFPQPGDLARGQTFKVPDDAFFSPDGGYIVATEEDDSVVSVISVAKHKIVYRYGTPGVPGSSANHVSNPDDAMMMPDGTMISADIENCRLLLLPGPTAGLHRPRRVIGTTGSCWHNPPHAFGSPNGAFPLTNGSYLVTEINGDWANAMTLNGHVRWSVHPPTVSYPSDTDEVYPGRYLTADYSSAGQVVEFDSHGRLLWRFRGLNHPSLALPLPNGDVLVNDDYNHRVIVIDPVTHRIVWQYGHKGRPGTAPGFLNDPDGVDLVPPNSMVITHAATMGTYSPGRHH
jgi:hypothetical protein